MKPEYMPLFDSNRLRFFVLFLLAPLVLSLLLLARPAAAQNAQLSLVDIITVLRSKKVSLEERNQLLTEGVRQRGITFALNADLEKELRTAGADDALVSAIRDKSPIVKVSATPVPKPEPTPIPVATPKPPDYTFYQNRANANFVLGEYDTAIVDYNKAAELNPKEPTIFFSRALAYFNNRNFSPAIADFDRVIELDPKEAMAYFKRGAALEKIGNFEKALADYQKTVALDSDNEPAKAAVQRLQAALPKPEPPRPTIVVQNKPTETKPTETVPTVMENAGANEPAPMGAMNRFATRLAMPVYPPFEKQRATEGLVTVEVVLDEEGKVLSAKATSGPKGLRNAAEDAARRSKFRPVIVGDKAIKATGFINYNFKAT
ncbi:MAG: tetratricopeptide repeat protein [Acidobacteria bacterium]|nr:tetratricopeptide repeat protein [Acidobacteriota bacterium]